jgi:hypothetical protein
MKFEPKTKDQIAEAKMWPAGEYPFEIHGAVPAISKKDNPMITLTLKVFNTDGQFLTVYDYLQTGSAFAEEKLYNAAEVCGLLAQYNAGELLPESFIGRQGHVWLAQGKAQNGYPAKNQVGNYITKKQDEDSQKPIVAKKKKEEKKTPDIEGDDIPW